MHNTSVRKRLSPTQHLLEQGELTVVNTKSRRLTAKKMPVLPPLQGKGGAKSSSASVSNQSHALQAEAIGVVPVYNGIAQRSGPTPLMPAGAAIDERDENNSRRV